eukprot:scaffold335426_cov17-Prasinocladus_malaysianus.AAC.1
MQGRGKTAGKAEPSLAPAVSLYVDRDIQKPETVGIAASRAPPASLSSHVVCRVIVIVVDSEVEKVI